MSWSDTAVIVLAAGSSSRMGSPKQLLDYGGKPLLKHAVEAALGACSRVIVVLGANASRIRPALAGLPAEIVENPRWQDGMGTSIHAGIRAAQAHGCGSAILMLGDQPLVSAAVLEGLIAKHYLSGKPIVAARYAGTVGVPALFAASHFGHLLALQPEQGCKGVILAHAGAALPVDCPEAEQDIDTLEDYERLAGSGIPVHRAG